MRFETKLVGSQGIILLESFPAEVVSSRGGPARAALRKGALVILKAEQANLAGVMGHQVDGQQRASTGFLLKNLVVTRGKPPQGQKGERYIVRPKPKAIYRTTDTGRARTGKAITSARLNAQRLEYGSSEQPAESFIRPAVNAKGVEAISVITTELVKGIDRVVGKLAAQNKGK